MKNDKLHTDSVDRVESNLKLIDKNLIEGLTNDEVEMISSDRSDTDRNSRFSSTHLASRWIANIRRQFQTANEERRSLTTLPMTRVVVTAVSLVATYIAIAIVAVPSGVAPEFNFANERGAITVMSAIFLAMGSGFAFASFLLSADSTRTIRCFWLLLAVMIGFLSVDELLEFHERVGKQLDSIDLWGVTSGTFIRGWNDVIVILYGVIAMPIGLIFLPTILRYSKFFQLLCIAAGCYVLHTAIDSFTEPPTTMSIMFEESAKLYCSTFIALAFLSGLIRTIQITKVFETREKFQTALQH